jgi:transcriptional regulator with XRE-family HTH domain
MFDEDKYNKLKKRKFTFDLPKGLARLRLLRELRGITHKELGSKFGYTKNYIVMILNGKTNPPNHLKHKICDFFKVDPLLIWEEEAKLKIECERIENEVRMILSAKAEKRGFSENGEK